MVVIYIVFYLIIISRSSYNYKGKYEHDYWTYNILDPYTCKTGIKFDIICKDICKDIKHKYFISNYIFVCHEEKILYSIIQSTLNFQILYKAPEYYYIIDNVIYRLKLPLSAFVLVHTNYYYNFDSDDEILEVIPEQIDHKPACIIVIINNNTLNIIHQENLYIDYALYYYVIGNTVVIRNQDETNPKLLMYNFENLL